MRTTNHSRWVIVLASVASFMGALDILVVSTALSTIRMDLDASIADLEWTIAAYSLSFGVLLMTGAALGDRFGRRRLFAVGLGLFSIASAGCALAPDATWLIASRAVQGVGAALFMPVGLALVGASVPAERRGAALGIVEGITGLATLAGPLLGGAVADGLGWEWIFWINVPIGLLAIPFVLTRIEESLGSDTAIDVRGLALVTGSALGLVWGLVRGNSVGWNSAEIVIALAIGVMLGGAFVALELRSREPMLPMRFFRSRGFSAGNAVSFLIFASLYGAVFFLAQFLQTGMGYTPLDAGLRLLPWTATLFVIAPVAGALVDRIGERPLLVGGLVLEAIGFCWIALIAEPDLAYAELVVPLVLGGAGGSMVFSAAQNAVISAVPESAVGKAAGTQNMVSELGGVFGIAIAVAVFASAGSYMSAQAFTDGFAPAIGGSAALALAGAIVALWIPGRANVRDATKGLDHAGEQAGPLMSEPALNAD